MILLCLAFIYALFIVAIMCSEQKWLNRSNYHDFANHSHFEQMNIQLLTGWLHNEFSLT